MARHLWLRHPRQVLTDALRILVGQDHVLVVRTLLVLGIMGCGWICYDVVQVTPFPTGPVIQ